MPNRTFYRPKSVPLPTGSKLSTPARRLRLLLTWLALVPWTWAAVVLWRAFQ